VRGASIPSAAKLMLTSGQGAARSLTRVLDPSDGGQGAQRHPDLWVPFLLASEVVQREAPDPSRGADAVLEEATAAERLGQDRGHVCRRQPFECIQGCSHGAARFPITPLAQRSDRLTALIVTGPFRVSPRRSSQHPPTSSWCRQTWSAGGSATQVRRRTVAASHKDFEAVPSPEVGECRRCC
jgi:hypothetical protein